MSFPKPPKVIKKEGNRAIIEISELYPGYGATIGNAFRRVLYSSLPGAAITSIKITGVAHEFSTMNGVIEDGIELGLNLKQIKLILHGDEPQMMTLKVKGVKNVKAKDIKTPSQVEIVNKDAHIATLTSSKSSLEMELNVERGLGYVQADKDEKEKKEIGVIRLDSIFTPVIKVNFEVEDVRVGDRTDYNRLVIDILTDGSISPEQAFVDSAKLLFNYFNIFSELKIIKTRKKVSIKKKPKKINLASDKKKTTKKTTKSKISKIAKKKTIISKSLRK